MPAMHLRRVDLPEPLCPNRPTVSPSAISRSMSRRAQNSSNGTRPKWMARSFSDVYFSWYSRKRLETLSTAMEVEATGWSELLGEVALEAAEHGQGDDEEDGADDDHPRQLPDVPTGTDTDGQDADAVRFGLVVDGPLEREDDGRHRVQAVEPRLVAQAVGHQPVLVHDRRSPEPGQQHQLQQVLGVAEVHVHGGQQDAQGAGEQ